MFYLSFLILNLSAYALLDEDDDDPDTKGVNRFALRMANKVFEEVQFWYNPKAFIDITNGSVIPSLSIVTDTTTALYRSLRELYGITVGDEELVENNKALKYILRLSPLTNNLMYYAGVASSDFAKDMGIKISAQPRAK